MIDWRTSPSDVKDLKIKKLESKIQKEILPKFSSNFESLE